MPDDLMQLWAQHVQRATNNLEILSKLQAKDLEAFRQSGQAASTTIESMNGLTWHDVIHDNTLRVAAAAQELGDLQRAGRQGTEAIRSALEDAGHLATEEWQQPDPSMMQKGEQAIQAAAEAVAPEAETVVA